MTGHAGSKSEPLEFENVTNVRTKRERERDGCFLESTLLRRKNFDRTHRRCSETSDLGDNKTGMWNKKSNLGSSK